MCAAVAVGMWAAVQEVEVGLFRRFLICERGATAIEYAMIAGTISMIILSALLSIGQSIQGFFIALRDGFPT